MPLIFLAAGLFAVSVVMFTAASRLTDRRKVGQRAGASIMFVVAMVMTGASVIRFVPAGHVQVETVFGRVTGNVIDAGAHVVNPLANWHQMNVRLQIFDFAGGEAASALSLDGTQLDLDTGFNFSLKPEFAHLIFEKIGDEYRYQQFVSSAAREAIRSAVAKFDWKAAATTERDVLAELMRTEFERNLVGKLSNAGLTAEEAQGAFQFAKVELRRVQPPAKVLNAISEKVAAEEDLERQITLTAIAEEAAKRRAQEGVGVQKLFEQLPENFEPSEISEVLRALAEKERADALMKAVEAGEVKVIVMNGGASAAVNIGD